MNSTTDAAQASAPNLAVYVAMGRARLASRAELARLEAERQEQERRAAIRAEWQPLMERVDQTLPPGFAACIVQPTEKPSQRLSRDDSPVYRPLVLDLTPLGLGPLGAYCDSNKEGGVGWAAPRMGKDEDSGRKTLHPPPSMSPYEIGHCTHTFVEALALAQDAASEVEGHNARLAVPAPDPYAPLAEKAGGCYPVLRIGGNRAEVQESGAEDAEKFGAVYGAEGWLANMAVHTFTFPGAPGGDLYAYLALVPVAPAKWRELVEGGDHAD